MNTSSSKLIFLALLAFTNAVLADATYGNNALEEKAIETVEEQKVQALAELNKACGTNVGASIQWEAYANFTESDLAGRTLDNVYQIAETQTLDVIREMAFACGGDAIFKKNVAKKLTAIHFSPNKGEVSVKQPSHVYQLSNGTLNVHYNFQTTNSSISDFRKLF
jgi:hypothetical protein